MTEIFVFGSNYSGRHGKGAALDAVKMFDAKYGVGEGRTGNAYAIPTKRDSKTKTCVRGKPILVVRSLDRIHNSILRFNKYAERHPDLVFLLTEIGCGHAGYNARDIAPLFMGATKLKNVYFPYRFIRVLGLSRERMSFDQDLNNVCRSDIL